MSEHKIQSTDAGEGVKRGKDFKERPEAPVEEEFDNFDSSPSTLRSKRLILDLYVPFSSPAPNGLCAHTSSLVIRHPSF